MGAKGILHLYGKGHCLLVEDERGREESFASDLFYVCRSEVEGFCNVHKDLKENMNMSNW